MKKASKTAKQALPVTISLARLKFSTINKITSCKEITNKLRHYRKQPFRKNNYDLLFARKLKRPHYDTVNMENHLRKLESKKIVSLNMENQSKRGPDRNDSILKENNHLRHEEKEADAPEDLKVILIDDSPKDTDDEDEAVVLKSPPKVLNDHIVIKHNLPVFVPPRERYSFLPKAQNPETVKTFQSIEIQTEQVQILTEKEYRIMRLIKSKGVSIELLTTMLRSINNENDDEDYEDVNNNTGNLSSNAEQAHNIGDSAYSLVNDDVFKKLLTHSEQNKALLKSFYGTISVNSSFDKIVNASTIIDHVLVDKTKRNSIAQTKILVDKDTQTDSAESNDNLIVYSPISDASDFDNEQSSTNDAATETDSIAAELSELSTKKSSQSQAENSTAEPLFQRHNMQIQIYQSPMAEPQMVQPQLEPPPPDQPRFPFQQSLFAGQSKKTQQIVQRQLTTCSRPENNNDPRLNVENNGQTMNAATSATQQLAGPMCPPFRYPWNIQSTIPPALPPNYPPPVYPQSAGFGATLPTSTTTSQRPQDIPQLQPVKPAQRGRPRGSMRTLRNGPYKRRNPQQKRIEQLIQRPIENTFERAVDRPIERSIERPLQRLIEETIERSIERPIERPADQLIKQPIQRSINDPRLATQQSIPTEILANPPLIKYKLLMEQQRKRDMEIQQRTWEAQLKNYPNSSWSQNFRPSQ